MGVKDKLSKAKEDARVYIQDKRHRHGEKKASKAKAKKNRAMMDGPKPKSRVRKYLEEDPNSFKSNPKMELGQTDEVAPYNKPGTQARGGRYREGE